MTLNDLYTDIENLGNINGIDLQIIGYSVLNNPIYVAHVGPYDAEQLIIEGSIHAREWITAPLLIEMTKYLNTQPLDFGIYIIPLVNPDGVGLVLEGANNLPQENKDYILQINGQNPDFSQWKANINAVDLNVNFDALWGGGAQNVTYPAPANFIGYEPNSEPEVKALIDFTAQVNPVMTLSYHTKGEVIYYGFEVLTPQQIARDYEIAKAIQSVTGYEPVLTQNSTGGYSDWVSQEYGVPAFTIEVGSASIPHPIGLQYLPSIYELNKNVPIVAYNKLKSLNQN